MSHIFAGILGAVAMSATFGAVQLASGSNLAGTPTAIAATAQSNLVNRAVKSDRASPVTNASASRTISVSPAGLDATSVLVRVPSIVTSVKSSQAASQPKAVSQNRRVSNFGCEPLVSVLTDVAKSLAPGRCIS